MNKLIILLVALLMIALVAGCINQQVEVDPGEETPGITSRINAWVISGFTSLIIIGIVLFIVSPTTVVNWGNAIGSGFSNVTVGLGTYYLTFGIVGLIVGALVIYILLALISWAISVVLFIFRIILPIVIPFFIYMILSVNSRPASLKAVSLVRKDNIDKPDADVRIP